MEELDRKILKDAWDEQFVSPSDVARRLFFIALSDYCHKTGLDVICKKADIATHTLRKYLNGESFPRRKVIKRILDC